jgi:tRNA A-37 threonylcarbamoyl transferase component Bud32
MAEILTCPQGHHWEAAPGGGPDGDTGKQVCPVCGALGGSPAEADLMATAAPPAERQVPTVSPAPPRAADGGITPPNLPGYEILGELGRGGAGVVYKARQKSLNRIVALKMLRAGIDAAPHELARFRAEAEAVARLQHPNIVQIHEVGEADGRPYFCLEYVDAGSLADRLRAHVVPPDEAAVLVEKLARAVEAAHQRGLIHRDLKPANVLLAADGTPKVTDFGLAKQLDRNTAHTQSGAILGTPSYMAPEQAAGRPRDIGPATDVYALGAILYEMLTGRPPFKGATLLETLDQVRWQPPVPPRLIQPGVPVGLDAICLKCLAKDRAARYVTPAQMAEDLQRFLAGQTPQARPSRGEGDDQTEYDLAASLSAGPRRKSFFARRWAAILVSCVLSAALGFFLSHTYKTYLWQVRAAMEYRPLEVQGQRRVYTPQSFDTVLARVSDRSNFDKLVAESGLPGLDPYLLANGLFKISRAGSMGEANIITVRVEWPDPAEGVSLVERFIQITQQRQQQDRIALLKDYHANQKEIVERKTHVVEKIRKNLEEYLKQKGIKDFKEESEYRIRRIRNLELAADSAAQAVDALKDKIKVRQAYLARLKEDKRAVSAADDLAFKERKRELERTLDSEKSNLAKAKKVLTGAQNEKVNAVRLVENGAGPKKNVEDATLQVDLATGEVQRLEKLLKSIEQALAELKPVPTALQQAQATLSELELIELPSAEITLARVQKELDLARKRANEAEAVREEARVIQSALTDAEKERSEQQIALQELGALRDMKNFELLVTDPARASTFPVSSTQKQIWIESFATSMAVLLPLILAYDWTRTRRRGTKSSGQGAGEEDPSAEGAPT